MRATAIRHRRLSLAVLVLVGLVIALLALAWWFPARWAWQRMRADYPSVRVSAVRGTVWHGTMDGLVVGGQRLGTLHWTLGRAAVFGHVHGTVDLRGTGIAASGRFARVGPHAVVIRDAQFALAMTRLRALWPTGMQLEGRLQGTVTRARLVSGWPSRLDAHVRWLDAAVVTRGRKLALGAWRSHWQASGGAVVTAHLRDAGSGALRLRGTFTGTPLGWRLRARLTPRGDAPGVRRLLRCIGKPAPDGTVRVDREGGLMAQTPWQ